MKKIKLFSVLISILVACGNCCVHGITVRKPNETEIGTIVEKFRGVVSWNTFTQELIRNNIDNVYIAYDDDNTPLACLRMSLINSETVHIHDLVTLKEHRRKGCAKELLNQIKEKYPDCKIELNPTKNSIEFYRKMGFEYLELLKICLYTPLQSNN